MGLPVACRTIALSILGVLAPSKRLHPGRSRWRPRRVGLADTPLIPVAGQLRLALARAMVHEGITDT